MPQTAAEEMSDALKIEALLGRIGAEPLVAEPGYVELGASAADASAGDAFSAGAIALLAEAAARLASPAGAGETAELSLHVHDLTGAAGAERLLARGELVREARPGRPLATAQADVFRVEAGGAEALLATALVSLIASK